MFNDIWTFFDSVEIVTPLAVMPMTDAERLEINAIILADLAQAVGAASDATVGQTNAEQYEYLNDSPESEVIRNLWRELASANARIINDQCSEVDEDDYEEEIEHILEMIGHVWNFDEQELHDAISNDGQIRMFIRRHGLDPDRVLANLNS
jgi:Asp-tRNA(Asn)/Glu-tRNA(Gln) amidotransferase C subunit